MVKNTFLEVRSSGTAPPSRSVSRALDVLELVAPSCLVRGRIETRGEVQPTGRLRSIREEGGTSPSRDGEMVR